MYGKTTMNAPTARMPYRLMIPASRTGRPFCLAAGGRVRASRSPGSIATGRVPRTRPASGGTRFDAVVVLGELIGDPLAEVEELKDREDQNDDKEDHCHRAAQAELKVL